MTIWSLVDRSVRHINLPKEASPCIDFSPGGTYVAVAERRSAKDCVAIYSCESWIQITVIKTPYSIHITVDSKCIDSKLIDSETVDLGGLKWSPDASKILVWDGVHAGKISVFSVTGFKIAQFELFGVHSVDWSPSAQLIAAAIVGSKVNFFRLSLPRTLLLFFN